MYDLVIIGGGPAGVAAGVYASRKRLKTVFITADFNSQSVVSENIQNWIGTVSIPGPQLAEDLKKHLLAYAENVVTLREGEWVKNVAQEGEYFKVTTDKETYDTKTVLIASGSTRRKLEVPGAEKYDNKGLTYCASCDGPLFDGKDVVVVGGGNASFETAAQLLAYSKSVTLLNRSATLKADPVTVEKVLAHQNMRTILNAIPREVKGDKFVNAIVYEDAQTKEIHELAVAGIFVEIGLIPSTSFAKELIVVNKFNQIVVDPKTQRASVAGIWAAGDCTDGLYHQNNIAAGDAVKALEDIYLYLHV
ncbi:pyridine nucleotide-disulfide oxidoreductase [Candidatus Parcubacteria bacterium]|nr:pyridine nucleotide-disulfide oxidoreductase [Candidatus Parcubacteria bacterium]